jgi:SAM-dependent methyltransferase
MIHHQSCPLCHSEKLAPWLLCRDTLVSHKPFQLARCSACGLVFTQDCPGEEEMPAYYQAEEYISHNPDAKGFMNRIYLFTREFMVNRKRKYIRAATGLNSGSLLDIGCGTGHFANTMKKAGWNVTGIEPDEKARNYAVTAFGLKVLLPGQIKDLEGKSFDCITMWHVLEHFHDPFGYAAEIGRLLKPGGVCLAALPNCRSFDAGYFRSDWAAYDVPRHLWHFTPSTFSEFADKTGFSVKKTGVLPLDVFYISILSEKARGVTLPFLSGLLKGSWFALRSLFRRSGSSSLYYLLTPKK